MAKKNLEEMDTVTEEDSAEIAKYDLLVKRDQEMTAFIDSFESTRTGILQEQQTAQDTIVLLLEDISKGLEDSASMPSMETHAEMEDAKVFSSIFVSEFGVIFINNISGNFNRLSRCALWKQPRTQ